MTLKTARKQLRKFGIEFKDANDLLAEQSKIPIGTNYYLSNLLNEAFKLQIRGKL